MGREGGGALAQFGKERRRVGSDQVGAQTVADDDDRPLDSTARHGTTPFKAASKISKLRQARDSVLAR